MNSIEEEAKAFDSQIDERIKNGHIPDLRYATKCDYFYNNPWRHPEYVKLDFVDQFNLISDSIKNEFPNKLTKDIRVLEIGCGPGYLCLELARAGYDVLGMDLSERCIEIAQEFANKDPHIGERGKLAYGVADLFEFNPEQKFDVVIFLGALHHFRDQQKVMDSVKRLLNSEGIVIAHEPTRDRVTKGNAIFYDLLPIPS